MVEEVGFEGGGEGFEVMFEVGYGFGWFGICLDFAGWFSG